LPEVDFTQLGEKSFEVKLLSGENVSFETEVVDSCVIYADFMETLFDFELIRALVAKDSGYKFRFCFDAMNGVTGPYAKHLFCERLGVDPK
jgi:phosphoglucomutase